MMLWDRLDDVPEDLKAKLKDFVVIVVKCGDKYLLLRRAPGKRWENKLNSPGGKVNKGETFERAGLRELEEETGIQTKLSDLELAGVVFRSLDDPRAPGRTVNRSIVVFLLEFPEDQEPIVRVDEEGGHTGWEWVSFDAIKDLEESGQAQESTFELIRRAKESREREPRVNREGWA